MKEVWKDIPGYVSRYQASNLGLIRSLDREARNGQTVKGRVLKQSTYGKGYYRVCFSNGNKTQQCKSVHILVMLAFVGPCPPGQQVRHYNGDKANNRLSNLRYGTRQQNRSDAIRLGEIPNAKPIIRSDGKKYPSILTACNTEGYVRRCIKDALNKGITRYGFNWEYDVGQKGKP